MIARRAAAAVASVALLAGACSGPQAPAAAPNPTGPPTIDHDFVRQHAQQFDVDVPNRPAGSQHELAAATYILGHLQFAGYAPVLDAVPVAHQVQSTNVVALPPGGADPAVVIAVAYDHDGRGRGEGTQIGLFLELARALHVTEPDHRVAFVALGAEGADNAGSQKLARTLEDYGVEPQVFLLRGTSIAGDARGACATEPSGGELLEDIDQCDSVVVGHPWLDDAVAGVTEIDGSGGRIGDALLRLLLSTAN